MSQVHKVQDCTSHKLRGENSLAVSKEKAEEQDNFHFLGENLEKTDLENPSRGVMLSASSEYEPTILKASHACKICKIDSNLVINNERQYQNKTLKQY